MTYPKRPLPVTSASVGLILLVLSIGLDALTPMGIIFRFVALCLAVSFVIRYSSLPWKQTAEGQHLMWFTSITAAFFAFALVNSTAMYLEPGEPMNHGHWPGRDIVALILYMGVSWELWQRNWLLTVANREWARERLRG